MASEEVVVGTEEDVESDLREALLVAPSSKRCIGQADRHPLMSCGPQNSCVSERLPMVIGNSNAMLRREVVHPVEVHFVTGSDSEG